MNTGPYSWSDYHIEFWDPTFQDRLDLTPACSGASDLIFENEAFNGTMVEFWAPEWQDPGEENASYIILDLVFRQHGHYWCRGLRR